MSERQHAPPTKLFELLEFCGIRQRDIVARLGVSKALVSLWRSRQREISPDYYTALLQFASAVFLDSVRALVCRAAAPAPEATKEALAVFDVFETKMQAAHAERDPTLMHERLLLSIVALHHTLKAKGEPATWNEDTLAYIEAEGHQIAALATALRSQITAAKAVASFQAQTSTTVHALLSTLKELTYAASHVSGRCASQSDPGPAGLRRPPTPCTNEEGLRATAGETP
jgi:transcriptional regulator with XRE-family HTH domain